MDFRKTVAEIEPALRRFALRAGWAGGLAAGLLVLAGLELATVTLPAQREAGELREQLRRVQESPRDRREIARREDSSPSAQLAAFERFFPEAGDMNRILRELHAAADKEQLLLERGEYKLSEEAGLPLLRYQVTLPVKGSYPSIRSFTRRVLQDMPTLSLDSIALQRPNVGDPVIEAQIRFSAFHRGER